MRMDVMPACSMVFSTKEVRQTTVNRQVSWCLEVDLCVRALASRVVVTTRSLPPSMTEIHNGRNELHYWMTKQGLTSIHGFDSSSYV